MSIPPETPVVFDVNIYVDFLLGDDGSWPLVPTVPPSTGNPSADAFALAFDGRFRLYASPHILRNVHRVTVAAGRTPDLADEFVAEIIEMCAFTGGSVVQPEEVDHGIGDFEDNAILSLAKDPGVDALIIVTRDSDFLDLGGSLHGRLLMHPWDFVRRVFN